MGIEVYNYTSTKKVTMNIDTFDKTVIDITSESSIETPDIPDRIVKFYLKYLRSKAIKVEHRNNKTLSFYIDYFLDRFFNLSFVAFLYLLGFIIFVTVFILGNNIVKIIDICALFTVINISILMASKRDKNDFELMSSITLDFYKSFARSNSLKYNISLQNPYTACIEMAKFIKLPVKITVDELKAIKHMYMYFEAYAEKNQGYLKYGLDYSKHFLTEI